MVLYCIEVKFTVLIFFNSFQELRTTWELHSPELFILPQFIEMDGLLLPTLWVCFFLLTYIFQSRLFNDTTNSTETTVNSSFISLWERVTEPGNGQTSDLPEKSSILFTFKLIVHEHCLLSILHSVKPVGIILAEENNDLWQSGSACFGDGQIVLHRSSLILTLSLVWL